MIDVEIKDNMMMALVEWQKRAVQSFQQAAQLYRSAVQESLDTEARTDREHAQLGFPRLKHTGDLRNSIHYVGGVEGDGNIYFEVFIASDYGVAYEPVYPVMEPVFMKSFTVLLQIMSSTGDERRGIFAMPDMFSLKTRTWFTREYDHEVNYNYPDVDLTRKVQSY